MTAMEKLRTRRGYHFNAFTTKAIFAILKNKVIKENNVHIEYHKPKAKSFILISNHTDAMDPGFEMVALGRYIRYVASDHTARMKLGWVFKYVGGVIIKHRDRPSSELTKEIIRNVQAGIPVGLHAEGAMSINGQTGFISSNTGKLVKDSGVALVTYRFVGGYLRKPRWANEKRSGPIIGHFVNEYSAEELSKLSVDEINEIIRRDTYVNAYEEQRKETHSYDGENLAECVERILYLCPKCGKAGTLHSKGNFLSCDCGYKVEMKNDGFFHDCGEGLTHDNVLDWDLWQRDIWKERVLSAEKGTVIFSEGGQIVKKVEGENEEILSEDATISLYPEKLVIDLGEGKDAITMEMAKIKQFSLAGKDTILVVDDKIFLDIGSKIPRSPTKYIAAWRYLTGKEYK